METPPLVLAKFTVKYYNRQHRKFTETLAIDIFGSKQEMKAKERHLPIMI